MPPFYQVGRFCLIRGNRLGKAVVEIERRRRVRDLADAFLVQRYGPCSRHMPPKNFPVPADFWRETPNCGVVPHKNWSALPL